LSISAVIAGERRFHVEVDDCLRAMARIPSGSVHASISSPPYHRMRNYGVAGQIGLERTVDEYVEKIVAVYREVYRVLRDDGLCWINLGDTFAQGGRGGIGDASTLHGGAKGQNQSRAAVVAERVEERETDLLGIPWRVVFALQRDGWIHRGEICWQKTSPMPESINGTRWVRHQLKRKNGDRPTDGREGAYPNKPRLKHSHHQVIGAAEWDPCPGCDRCSRPGPTNGFILRRGSWRPTRSHEYVFLLAKSKGYYADEIAAKEPVTGGAHARGNGVHKKAAEPGSGIRQNESFSAAVAGLVGQRNRRSVWTTGPQPFVPDRLNLGVDVEGVEHFAVFPPALIEPMVAISTSEGGCCSICGAPFARMLGDKLPAAGQVAGARERHPNEEQGQRGRVGHHNSFSVPYEPNVIETIGWAPTCKCAEGGGIPVPAIVLDPFCGSGTTGVVALRQRRRFIGLELNPRYALLAARRIAEDQPLFNRSSAE
jgi:DNA modification methylase